MNPVNYALNSIRKKAQELFNPVVRQAQQYIKPPRAYTQTFNTPLTQAVRQIPQRPIYNVPNSPTYGQLGNTIKQYGVNQVLKPIVQGSFQFNDPKASRLQKAEGFLKGAQGVFSAHPVGLMSNTSVGSLAGLAKAVRTKGNIQKEMVRGMTHPTSPATEGLGIKNPLLALGVDLLAYRHLDPIPSGGFGNAASEIKGLVHKAPIELLTSHEGAPDVKRVLKYMQDIKAGKKIDPLKIINEGAKYGIEDGKHRFEAFRRLGFKEVPVEFARRGQQAAASDIKLPVSPELKIVNGKVKVKMKPVETNFTPFNEASAQKSPRSLLSSQESAVGSGLKGGGGSSIKNITEFENPQDPYFNVKKLNVSKDIKQAVKGVIEEVKPKIESVVGKPLSNKEVVDFSNKSSKVLRGAVGRGQTREWTSAMLKTRELLAHQAQTDTLSPEFLKTLITVKSQSADIARKLQSLSIGADPKTVNAKQAILEAVLKVTDNTDDILKAAEGVNFNNQAEATAFYRQFVKPKTEDWLTLLRYNSMLSSPSTHVVNISSNYQGSGLVAPIEKTISGGLDWMRSAVTNSPRKQFAGEGPAYAKAYYSKLGDAAQAFGRVMKGESMSGNPDIRSLPLTTKKGLANTAENVLSLPMKLLEGMDQFFSTLTSAGIEKSLAYRQSKGVNVGSIASAAQKEAAYRLFRGDLTPEGQGVVLNSIDEVTKLLFNARSNSNPIVRTIAQFTFPFVKTPMNIVKQMVEYSPAGVLTMPGATNKTEQLSKAIMGMAVGLGAAQLLSSDRITWAEPTSEKQKNAFRAAGMQPYAVKIGDKWISYAKLHPVIGFNLALVASLYDSYSKKKLTESEVDTVLNGLANWGGYFADQSYIKNMGDLVSSARGDTYGIARMLSNYPSQVIPYRAFMSWIERIIDPVQRQADSDGSLLQKQLQYIAAQIPGIASTVPPRLDSKGNPVPNQNRLINAVSPARVTTENPQQRKEYEQMLQKARNTAQTKEINKNVRARIEKGEQVNPQTPQEYKAIAGLKDATQAGVVYDLLSKSQFKADLANSYIKEGILTNNVVKQMVEQKLIDQTQATALKGYIKQQKAQTPKPIQVKTQPKPKVQRLRARKPKKFKKLKLPKAKKLKLAKIKKPKQFKKIKVKTDKKPEDKFIKWSSATFN